MMTFSNCVCLGDVDQAETFEPQQTEASHLTSVQDMKDSKTAETEEILGNKSPHSASPTQKVMLKSSSPDPPDRDYHHQQQGRKGEISP